MAKKIRGKGHNTPTIRPPPLPSFYLSPKALQLKRPFDPARPQLYYGTALY